jgi:hypothetical protein
VTENQTESDDDGRASEARASPQAVQAIMTAVDQIVQEQSDAAARQARRQATALAQAPVISVPERLPEEDPWLVRRKPPAAASDTETLLNGLIEECGFLMREVAFRLIVRNQDFDSQVEFLDRAMRLATTGSSVGLAVAELRKASRGSETHERIVTHERLERRPPEEKTEIRENQ